MKQIKWYIWSNEHKAWWKANSLGYTRRIEDAGQYSLKEARDICNQANVFVTDEQGTTEPDEVMVPVE